jgi:PhnB protein
MTSRLNPYLNFKDTAREAMEFYQQVFGGELTIHTFGEYGDPDAPIANLVMHGMLETPNGFTLMAADTPPGMDHMPSLAMSVSLSGDDAELLRGYWEQLSAGGEVSVPLEAQMWGDSFGAVVDRFGTPWMVNIAGS